jgi:hypothetical protein
MKAKYPLVVIKWEDAYSGNHDWFKSDTLPEAVEPLICYTTGFIVQSNSERITVAQSFSHDSLATLWTIPRRMIIEIIKGDDFELERGDEIDA